jgi:putative peptidoglycan lipid II flippase
MLPYAAMICTVAVLSGVLNVRGHFALPAAAPIVLNVFNIAALVIGVRYLQLSDLPLIYLVSVSVLAAGLLQLVAVGAAMRWLAFAPVLNADWRNPGVRKVISLMAPMALGLSAVQVNTLLDNVIAYLFIVTDGERDGPTVLGYAQVLYQLPLGVVGISIATAIFPVLSARAAAGDSEGLAQSVERGVRLALFIALPSTIGLILIATPLVSMLYERGEFNPADTPRVAGTLLFYSLGLAAYFTQHIVVRAFYSLHDSSTPARSAGVMVIVNLAMNLVLVRLLQERGLALSTATCASVQVIWLGHVLRRSVPQIRWRRIGPGLLRTLVASGIMAAGLLILDQLLLGWQFGATFRVAAAVSVGCVVYGLSAAALRIPELYELIGRLRR